jgi:hypothetical protein
VDSDVFFKILLPILGVNNTSLLAITTPDDHFNYFSKLLKLRDKRGNLIFRVQEVQLQCDACKRKAIDCKHRRNLLPQWKDSELQDKISIIMGANINLSARETMGMIVTDCNFIYKQAWIEALFARNDYRFNNNSCPVLHMGIDPNAGSGKASSSSFTATTIGIQNGIYTVNNAHIYILIMLYRNQ